ncbi:Protein Y73F8A.35 b, partial [Aphelenchoides avenae]
AISPPQGPPTDTYPPDVHMLILDSVSSAQLTRSMPKSLHFLYNEMGAVNFRFVNKNGLNSRPNAYALLFGKQTYNLTDDVGSSDSTFEADVDGEQLCYTPLDDEPFIAFDFQRRGYKTMMAEDWALGAVNWFNCTGFKRPPTDHYMRRFTDDQCRGIHLYLLDYFKDFIDAYAGKPKFSLTWISYLSHDTPNGVYELDDQLLEILKDYKEKLSNSFLLLMGDHGLRFGKVRTTRQGEIEDNNPALVMTVPERLRSNKELMANLHANSKQLVTHYDTYATLLHIAT